MSDQADITRYAALSAAVARLLQERFGDDPQAAIERLRMVWEQLAPPFEAADLFFGFTYDETRALRAACGDMHSFYALREEGIPEEAFRSVAERLERALE